MGQACSLQVSLAVARTLESVWGRSEALQLPFLEQEIKMSEANKLCLPLKVEEPSAQIVHFRCSLQRFHRWA